jgi:Galactose oxidase, central domain/Kelch motif
VRVFTRTILALTLGATGAAGSANVAAAPSPGGAVAPARWVTLAPSLLQRGEVSAARVGHAIYVVGGFGANSMSTAAVERFDLSHRTWTLSLSLPHPLNHMSAIGYHGSLYVVGGYSQPGDTSAGAVRDFWRFDPTADIWRALPPAPIARAAAGAAVLGHRLYVAGGRSDTSTTIATTAIYDFDTGRWSLGPPLHHAREHVAAVAAGGAVWLLGGRALGQGNFADVERLRPGARSWQRMRPMPIPRSSFQAVDAAGTVVVVGGEGNGATFGEVDALDPATDRWTRLADLPHPRHGLGLVASGSLVYAIEGGPQAGLTTSRTVEVLRVP